MSKIILFSLILFSVVCAEEKLDYDMQQVSETFGHLIYRNFTCLDVPFDVAQIVQGIQNAAAGKKSAVSEQECINAIHEEQQKKFKVRSINNLKQANAFLESNGKKEGIICLKQGKLQYRQLIQGSGAAVKDHSMPTVRYTLQCKGPDDEELLQSNVEEKIDLDYTIDGLRLGLLGMKEGEKRILYIHPDLAYGEKGLFVYLPNALLTYEIEVLQAF